MKKIILGFVISAACYSTLTAQTETSYQRPPKEIEEIMLAPATPEFSISPLKDRYIILQREDIPSIQEQALEDAKLAGHRVLKSTNCPRVRIKIKSIEVKLLPGQKGPQGMVQGFPDDVNIINYSWSPDGKAIAACVQENNGINLWLVDVANLLAKKLTDSKLNFFFGPDTYSWSPDSKTILVSLVDAKRGAIPSNSDMKITPIVQDSDGKKKPVPTFQDLLDSKYSELLFDFFATSELCEVAIADGGVKRLGAPSIYADFAYSPDGSYILTQTIGKPYSYNVPSNMFAKTISVIDRNGILVKEILKTNLQENVVMGNNSTLPIPRNFSWRNDTPATLYWVEPLDGGNGKAQAAYRDRIMTISEPFSQNAIELIKSELRFEEIQWGDDNNAFLTMFNGDTKQQKCIVFSPSNPSQQVCLFDRSAEDLYGEWGNFITTKNQFGRYIILSYDKYKTVYLSGKGYSPEGSNPFIDVLNLKAKSKKRIWQSMNPYYEYPVEYLDLAKGCIITSKESVSEVPNFYIRNIKGNKIEALTDFKNPYPSLVGVTKQVIEYKRKDSVNLSGILYLPANYKKENGSLPVLIWAYPTEYKSGANAGQRSDSPNKFIRVGRISPILWVTQGYAIFDNASFPIIGEGDAEPNDTYMTQLVNNAEAAIDKLVELGVGDRKRMAVGGHSYGAFMTANLLTNSNLFAAGIARSGAYNRTLTPFGFQNEERTFWEAPDVYLKMSPFVAANQLKAPLLLIHGQADNNTGTFTMQSERFFMALKGNGGIARLVLLPYESHGYVAKESILHQAWETNEWLNKYVKNKH